MSGVKISIIIPVYNAEKSLDYCVSSVLKQEYSNFELILVDDGSTDGSKDICKKYQEQDERVRFFSNMHRGVSAARNKGIKNATGDIIGFLDSDDMIHRELFRCVEKVLSYTKVYGVIFRHRKMNLNDTEEWGKKKLQFSYEKINVTTLLNRALYDNSIMGGMCNKYFRKEIYNNLLFDEQLSYCEDTHLLIRILDEYSKKEYALIDSELYAYIINQQSATHGITEMYEDDKDLKYCVSLKAILRDCNLTIAQKKSIYTKMFVVAASAIRYHQYENVVQREILGRYCKKYFRYFLWDNHIGVVEKLKLMIRVMQDTLKNGKKVLS